MFPKMDSNMIKLKLSLKIYVHSIFTETLMKNNKISKAMNKKK